MGSVYVAFVVNCFSRAIVGWHATTVKDTAMVTIALKMVLWRRDHADHRIDAGLSITATPGSQYMSIAFAETLVLEGIAASIGGFGDAYDNALAETTVELFKTEAVGRGTPFLAGPLRILDDVEYATINWVDWYNGRRLHSQLNYIPPEEYETTFRVKSRRPRRRLNHESRRRTGSGSSG